MEKIDLNDLFKNTKFDDTTTVIKETRVNEKEPGWIDSLLKDYEKKNDSGALPSQ